MEPPRIHTIPGDCSFADVLADGLWRRADRDPVRLGQGIVLVPHRRAVRVLADAFLRLGRGRAMLLPEIRAVGDVDEDEPFGDGAFALEAETGAGCPPAISELRRQLLLTRLVMRYLSSTSASAATPPQAARETTSPDQAARLARELARLLDQMQTEGVAFDALATLVPDEHAGHWRQTLDFLSIVTEFWPRLLEEEGAIDPAVRRDRLLGDLAERWTREPPVHPVTIAGSTGSVPATARLMDVVSRLPRGAVVLPGLDQGLDDASWRAVGIDSAHPQHALAVLLARLNVPRADVTPWPPGTAPGPEAARARLLREAMRPAETTDRWRDLSPRDIDLDGLTGFSLVECASVQEEAGVIALAMREALESEARTCALITPDRALARRVKSELRRWEIEVDDSAGLPLADTPPLAFWRLTGAMVAAGMAPVPLLAALKHPLARGGLMPGVFRRRVRLLERLILRGPRPGPGIDGLLSALERDQGDAGGQARARIPAGATDDLIAWLRSLAPNFRDFETAIASPAIGLQELLLAHNALVEMLAATETDNGTSAVWAGDMGEEAATFLADLFSVARDWPEMSGGDYLALLDALLDGKTFRPRFGTHPRLAILGPLEGRLHAYDRVVLGGLNEGVWPPETAADPWLSRPMRHALGLPLPEVRIGQSAHDFVQACGAREVMITRSERVGGTPTVPSRWLLRIQSVLDAVDASDLLRANDTDADWRGWQASLDAAKRSRRLEPPRPMPPVSARPRSFSVTQIGTWQRNPYAIYARRILELSALDPLDGEPGAADRGNLIHDALDGFIRSGPSEDPDRALAVLLDQGRRVFEAVIDRPSVWAFWWPRFERIARWFIAAEVMRAPSVAASHSEIRGEIELPSPAGPIKLTAIADRLDHLIDGRWTIIDYKTGMVPRRVEVDAGLAPQLPLEALILRRGGFAGLTGGEAASLDYWRLTGGEPAGEMRVHDQNIDALIDDAEAGLTRLIEAFGRPETPYLAVPDPDLAPRYDDYAHLARIKEWSS
jgi:ATP-dependent helicase/nuclease subunit B